jgi:hypothetical protein
LAGWIVVDMKAYIFGAGASVDAGYPLASQLLHGLSNWLNSCDSSTHWVPWALNRILQVRETFGGIDDFEEILGKLEQYGTQRVRPTGPVAYRQEYKDLAHDCLERLGGSESGDPNTPAEGFYPQYLRSDLILALREYFYHVEERRNRPSA